MYNEMDNYAIERELEKREAEILLEKERKETVKRLAELRDQLDEITKEEISTIAIYDEEEKGETEDFSTSSLKNELKRRKAKQKLRNDRFDIISEIEKCEKLLEYIFFKQNCSVILYYGDIFNTFNFWIDNDSKEIVKIYHNSGDMRSGGSLEIRRSDSVYEMWNYIENEFFRFLDRYSKTPISLIANAICEKDQKKLHSLINRRTAEQNTILLNKYKL